MMKKLLIIVAFVMISIQAHHGFTPDTLIMVDRKAEDVLHPLEILEIGDTMVGFMGHLTMLYTTITERLQHLARNSLEIVVGQEIITCGVYQLFYCANKQEWIPAKDLTIDDALMTTQGTYIGIDAINALNKPHLLISLVTTAPHIYAVSSHKILVKTLRPHKIV